MEIAIRETLSVVFNFKPKNRARLSSAIRGHLGFAIHVPKNPNCDLSIDWRIPVGNCVDGIGYRLIYGMQPVGLSQRDIGIDEIPQVEIHGRT